MQGLDKKYFKTAVTVSLVIALILFLISFVTGKEQFFLLLNGNGGRVSDYFFMIFTYGGDGILWIPVLLITLFILKRKDVLPLLISDFALSTILTQVVKNIIMPGTPRPAKVITDSLLIHIVKGVEVYKSSTF